MIKEAEADGNLVTVISQLRRGRTCLFAAVGLVCVGGGYASMPLIQAEVIDQHGWLTMTEFVDIFTLSQMTPGPIGINAATFVGSKVAGIPGSIAATLGFVFPSVFTLPFLLFCF